MKNSTIMFIVLISSAICHAGEANFSKAKNCYDAGKVVEKYVGPQQSLTRAGYKGAEICAKDFSANKELSSLYEILIAKCDETWGQKPGSSSKTTNAYCVLKSATAISAMVDQED